MARGPLSSACVSCAVSFGARRFRTFGNLVTKVLFFTFSGAGKNKVYCEVYCLTNAQMRSLHCRTKGIDRPTTVLSFPADPRFPRPDLPKGLRYLGEVYLAPDYIKAKGAWPLVRYLVHGALHLLGYTHRNACDRIEMESMEAKLALRLKEKGVG